MNEASNSSERPIVLARTFPIVVLLAVGVLFFFLSDRLSPDPFDSHMDALAQYHEDGLLDVPSVGFGGPEAFQFTLSTALESMTLSYDRDFSGVLVNSFPRDSGFLNIYFFRDDPANKLASLRGNCVAFVDQGVIVGDLSAVERLQGVDDETLARYDVPELPDYLKEELGVDSLLDVQRSRNANVIYWILLHEIGHIAHRHDSHFFMSLNDAMKNGPSGATVILASDIQQMKQETEADEFVLEVLKAMEVKGVDEFQLSRSIAIYINAGFNSFIYRELPRLAALQGVPGINEPGKRVRLKVSPRDTHPPYLLRAIWANRMLVERFEVEPPKFMDDLLALIQVEVSSE